MMPAPDEIKANASVKQLIKATAELIDDFPFTFDADAEAFFDEVAVQGGSLTQTEKLAINAYVISGKANAWWANSLLDYPMVGGTINSCKVNLRNPSTFLGTFINTISGDFKSTGWQPNGNSYMKTGFIPNDELTIQQSHIEYYARGGGNTGGLWGVVQSSSQILDMDTGTVPGDFFAEMYGSAPGASLQVTIANTIGGFTASRIAANDFKGYKNGVVIDSAVLSQGILPTIEIYLGCRNGFGTADRFSNTECAGAQLGNGLTSDQAISQYNDRNTMNTTLSRNV